MTPLVVLFALAQSPALPPSPPDSTALAIEEAVRKAAFRPVWPGFDPVKIPLAVFDGEKTFLFRHPQPPPEFRAVPNRPGTAVVDGRHPLVRANTSVTLGSVPTATLLADAPEGISVRESAATAVHEAFHVFQAERHPKWGGNEVDLFTYPTDDPDLLQLSRLETEALRRALAASGKRSACWAAAALDSRRRRFVALGETGVLYERGTELKEGLARLVESRVRGRSSAEPVFPENEFAVGDVRSRSYAVGHAFGLLLDRFDPGWELDLESGGEGTLDDLLSAALSARSAGRPCRFTGQETARALDGAKRSVELARMTRTAVREDFFRRPGWTLVVVAGAEPLAPQAFDPLNVERIGPGEVMHSRWVKLGNAAGVVEVLNARSVTESAGKHPLFDGVRRLTVTGLPAEPMVNESASGIAVEAAGVAGRFAGARWERKDRTTTIHLSKGR